jgi:hypothetical protein
VKRTAVAALLCALLTVFVGSVVGGAGVGALFREEWLRGSALVLLSAAIFASAKPTARWFVARHAKLSHPHSDSN